MSSIASPTTTMRHAAIFLSKAVRRSRLKRRCSVIRIGKREARNGKRAARTGRVAACTLPASRFSFPVSSWQYTLFPEPIGESDPPHKPRLVDSSHVPRVVEEVYARIRAHRVPPPRQLRAECEA